MTTPRPNLRRVPPAAFNTLDPHEQAMIEDPPDPPVPPTLSHDLLFRWIGVGLMLVSAAVVIGGVWWLVR